MRRFVENNEKFSQSLIEILGEISKPFPICIMRWKFRGYSENLNNISKFLKIFLAFFQNIAEVFPQNRPTVFTKFPLNFSQFSFKIDEILAKFIKVTLKLVKIFVQNVRVNPSKSVSILLDSSSKHSPKVIRNLSWNFSENFFITPKYFSEIFTENISTYWNIYRKFLKIFFKFFHNFLFTDNWTEGFNYWWTKNIRTALSIRSWRHYFAWTLTNKHLIFPYNILQ